MSENQNQIDRRGFLKNTATGISAATVGASVLQAAEGQKAKSSSKTGKVDPKDLIWKNKSPSMEYRRLGRTNFMCSRLVAGWIRDESLWRRLLARGVNYYDNARGYGNYEVELSKFLQKYRDKLWITSKSTGIAGYNKIHDDVVKLYRQAMKDYLGDDSGKMFNLYQKSIEKEKATGKKPDLRPIGKLIAALYSEMLDESLKRMGIDYVDCYMMHGIEIPWIFDCHELWEAYEKAHKAGKAKHFGYSVHRNHKEVMAASVEANKKGPWKIDLVMPGVNPASFDRLKPELEALKKQDVGIIAMKTKGIANRPVDGREKKFKSMTDGKEYNEYERAKLWMLHLTENLIDSVIIGVKNSQEMEKDLALPMVKLTAEAKRELRAIVKYEMAGICHLCGNCSSVCPELIEVTDMIRYHAYIHQYDEKEMARELYAIAGYDPATICNHCGKCEEACLSNIPITKLLHQLSRDMA